MAQFISNTVWFCTVGWILAGIMMTLGILFCCTIIGIPVGVACFGQVMPLSFPFKPQGGEGLQLSMTTAEGGDENEYDDPGQPQSGPNKIVTCPMIVVALSVCAFFVPLFGQFADLGEPAPVVTQTPNG